MDTKLKKSFIKQLEKHKNIIAKERDGLRDLQRDLDSLTDISEQGLVLLEEAIDLFSQEL